MSALYEGVDVWIADCLTRQPHPTHMHLDGVLSAARDLASARSISCTWVTASIIGPWSTSCPTGPRRPMTGSRSPMMTNDMMLGGVYLLMAIMLVLGALMTRREPAREDADHSAGLDRDFRRRLRPVHVSRQFRLGYATAEGRGTGNTGQEGKQTRIPMAIDGHFWVDAELNGQKVKFLVDSGATMTTIGRDIARKAGVRFQPQRDRYVRTGNGTIRVATGRARELKVGDIVRRDVAIEIADNDNLNVLGMNYLSSLTRWGVEGRWLILEALA